MEVLNVNEFLVMGISVRTINENGRAAKDIGELWNRFFADNVLNRIPDRLSDEIYSIYTDYEGDYKDPYNVVLGCKVPKDTALKDGLVSKMVKSGKYTKFVAKGDLNQGVVYKEWEKIWNIDSERVYDTDFEVYGDRAKDPSNAEVDIFVAFK